MWQVDKFERPFAYATPSVSDTHIAMSVARSSWDPSARTCLGRLPTPVVHSDLECIQIVDLTGVFRIVLNARVGHHLDMLFHTPPVVDE